MHHRRVRALACALVTTQDRPVSRVLARIQRRYDNGRKLSGILQAEIRALTRQRMYGVRRVADQGNAAHDIFLRMLSRKRKYPALAAYG